MAETKVDPLDAINATLKALRTKFGQKYVGFGSEVLDREHIRHSSGVFALDDSNGGGLIVNKKVITIAGDESSGKTMTALIAIANMQKEGGLCAWLDIEHSFDAMWATKLGVDVSKLVIAQPMTIEEATDTIEALIMSGSFALIVLDSVASAPSDKELEDSAEQKSMGGIGKPVGTMMRKITARLNDINSPVQTCVLLINQIREKVGISFGNPNYMPAGRALRFHSDIIIWLRPDNQPVGGKEEPIGINVNYIFKKNRTYPPFKVGTYHLLFWKGKADNNQGILEASVETGVIAKVGSKYTYRDKSASDDKTMLELLSGRGYFSKSNLKECHPRADQIIASLVEDGLIKESGSRFRLVSFDQNVTEGLIAEGFATKAYVTNFPRLVDFFERIRRNDWEDLRKEVISRRKLQMEKFFTNKDDFDVDEEKDVFGNLDLEGL